MKAIPYFATAMRKDHLNIILAVSILALSTAGCHKAAQSPEAARVISFVNEEMRDKLRKYEKS